MGNDRFLSSIMTMSWRLLLKQWTNFIVERECVDCEPSSKDMPTGQGLAY